jgi:hypothetical protein
LRSASSHGAPATRHESAQPSRESAPKYVADRGGWWYSRPHKDPPLLRNDRHDVVTGEELDLSMTAAESRRTHEDRQPSGDSDRAIVPLDPKTP